MLLTNMPTNDEAESDAYIALQLLKQYQKDPAYIQRELKE